MTEVKQRVTNIETRVTKIELRQENEICPNIQLLVEGHTQMAVQLKSFEPMKKTVEDLKSDVEVIKPILAQHSQRIHRLEMAQ